MQAEGIKGDDLDIPVNKLFRHKKSQQCELDQCKQLIKLFFGKTRESLDLLFSSMFAKKIKLNKNLQE